MKQCYVETLNFRPKTLLLISKIGGIIGEYVAKGYRLTVRQLYYQLVSRDIVPNTEKSYKNIIGVVNDGRLAGLIDWDAIEDRTRAFRSLTRWDSASQILRSAANGFHKDMWEGQRHRVFVIIEKDALAGVIQRPCAEYDVPYLAARGYPSATVLREFVERDLLPVLGEQEIIILHLGDHDPSGIDMSRDLEDRIRLFLDGASFDLDRIALNMPQIKELKPPPNPAKVTDSRFDGYMRKHGNESWELDALPPDYLADLLRANISQYVDSDQWDTRQAEIDSTKKKITALAAKFKE